MIDLPAQQPGHLDPILQRIATFVGDRNREQIFRVAVDGVDGVGKTTFADKLSSAIERIGRPVIRASVDGFHNPRELRYRRGRASPEGFYLDSGGILFGLI
jgi:uridine kinase